LKTASWLLSLLLAGLLVYSFAQVPPRGSIRSLHVASRYEQRSEAETGIHSKAGAIAADYRSTDLLAAAALLFTAALCVLLFFNQPPRFLDLFSALPLLLLGFFLALGTGLLCVMKGSNFLDYEGLAAWTGPLNARPQGALALLGGALLVLGGFLALVIRWLRAPGGPSGR